MTQSSYGKTTFDTSRSADAKRNFYYPLETTFQGLVPLLLWILKICSFGDCLSKVERATQKWLKDLAGAVPETPEAVGKLLELPTHQQIQNPGQQIFQSCFRLALLIATKFRPVAMRGC